MAPFCLPDIRRALALLIGLAAGAALAAAAAFPGAATAAPRPSQATSTTGGTALMPVLGGVAAVLSAPPAAPVPVSPPDGATVPDFAPTVAWDLPLSAAQYHLQVIPANDDGPGLDLIRPAAGWFTLPDPTQWYGLLPDMSYTWRVRASDAITPIGSHDASWGPWSAPRRFRTPPVSSASITLEALTEGVQVADLTPLLRWREADPNVWYYEVQVSTDPTFTTDPQRATAPVYWELRHGEETDPPRSYQVPEAFPLEEGRTYYWRVRPRVQGDGRPVTWPAAASFRTPVAGSASPPANSTPPGSEPAVLEELVLDQINAVRALHGLPSLAAATELTAAARRHSADMAAHAFLDHTGSDGSSFTQRITEAGYGWSRAGEIVAKGYPDAAAVVLGWMNSPDHRAIIMTPDYRDVGAGVARGADGALYWTVDFGARR